jgi:hypothetical protein
VAKRILRPSQIYSGPKGSKPGSLPVAKTTLFKDFIHRPGEPSPNIPGTNVERMTLIPLGDKSVGVLEDDVDRVIVQLAAERLDSKKRLALRAAVRAGQDRAREQRAREKLQKLVAEKAAAAQSAAD